MGPEIFCLGLFQSMILALVVYEIVLKLGV